MFVSPLTVPTDAAPSTVDGLTVVIDASRSLTAITAPARDA
jgi:hypothetical protein